MNIANLRIGKRLALGFGFVCLALVAMVGQATYMLGHVNEGTHALADERMPRIVMTTRMLSEVNDIAIALRNMLLNNDAGDRAKQVDEVLSSRKEIATILAALDKTLRKPQTRELLRQQVELNDKYIKGQDGIMALLQRDDDEGAKAYLGKEVRPVLAAYKGTIDQQIKLQVSLAGGQAADAQQVFEQTRMLMVAFGLLTLAAACALGYWITVSITRPLQRAVTVADAVAGGDLTSRIDVAGKCEVSDLLRALKAMNEHLAVTVGTVRSGTDAIALASGEVASGNQDLSSRTEQQASALEETASSMEELTSTVKQNADNARQANVLAETASSVANRGGQVISQVVETMDGIHAASSRITDIIGVIDGIAFQTNILALNAAVEAARAGEQGRGFAVVASEVRSLAQRSAAAAKEIKTLIADSGQKVDAGSRLVQEAGSTMGEIVESVRRVTDILNEITSASVEQSAGIEQINEAVTQMDAVTQQNAALVEQAAAAAQALQDEAARLADAVSVFRIDAAATVAERRPAERPTVARPSPARGSKVAIAAPSPARAMAATADWEEF